MMVTFKLPVCNITHHNITMKANYVTKTKKYLCREEEQKSFGSDPSVNCMCLWKNLIPNYTKFKYYCIVFVRELTFYKTGNQYPHIQLIVSEATFSKMLFYVGPHAKAQAMFASHIILRVLL